MPNDTLLVPLSCDTVAVLLAVRHNDEDGVAAVIDRLARSQSSASAGRARTGAQERAGANFKASTGKVSLPSLWRRESTGHPSRTARRRSRPPRRARQRIPAKVQRRAGSDPTISCPESRGHLSRPKGPQQLHGRGLRRLVGGDKLFPRGRAAAAARGVPGRRA